MKLFNKKQSKEDKRKEKLRAVAIANFNMYPMTERGAKNES